MDLPSQSHLSGVKRQKTRVSPELIDRISVSTTTMLEEDHIHKSTSHLCQSVLSSSAPSSKKVVPMKGRRRFLADLDEAASAYLNGLELNGFRMKDVKSGEEEGLILCEVVRTMDNLHVISLNLTVPDTSEYPGSHYFICFSQDEEVPTHLLSVIESVADQGPRSIDDVLRILLTSIAKKMATIGKTVDESDEEDEDMGSEMDMEMFDDELSDDDHLGFAIKGDGFEVDTTCLTRDFIEMVATGYRPGLVRFGADDLVISVSIPSFTLANSISPRALTAWDPRLLSASRHLTLLITGIRGIYPIFQSDGTLKPQCAARGKLRFRVGLSKNYKPNKEQIIELMRSFTHQEKPVGAKPKDLSIPNADTDEEEEYDSFDFHAAYRTAGPEADVVSDEERDFIPFSLSSSLEPLLDDRIMDLLQYRLRYSLGWAGAEVLVNEVHRLQIDADTVLKEHLEKIRDADTEEEKLLASYKLPPDPLQAPNRTEDHVNMPLLVFSYLLRRLTLCSRFCLICYDRMRTNFEALKPYVCENKLCTYQYYNLNRGPSLEYEICSRPQTVDLLISLTYVAAVDGVLEDFPDGMNLVVTPPSGSQGSLVDFDRLHKKEKQQVVANLLGCLPPVEDMKKYIERKRGPNAVLRDFDPKIPVVAWSVLRWCIASCTAHLEELKAEEDRVGNVGSEWLQFRFTVGAPDAEAKFAAAQEQARAKDANSRDYPSLYAFHGSPVKNWHSIIRKGLWYKTITNGRAYGDGVYFAKDGTVSMYSYTGSTSTTWPKTALYISSCVALAEIINLPAEFRSSHPFFVVPQTHWIVCRYLLVKTFGAHEPPGDKRPSLPVPQVNLDPKHPLTIGQNPINIPDPTYLLDALLQQRKAEHTASDFDEGDRAILCAEDNSHSVEDDWIHDPGWVRSCIDHMLPAPLDATPMATTTLQKELNAMLKEQERSKSLKELGWYMPPDFIGDNLFQWVVELHSFEEDLPITRDLLAREVNSLVFEIRFPYNYPHSPPFFRILKPRFLPFIQGGGGHVTGGGSMCMDLLTADGWLPSYSISAVLLQIKLAISNLDPRPARLSSDWERPYSMQEALEGYKRAAQTHGWRVPATLDRLSATW